MEKHSSNQNLISKKGSPKPYERKIKINQINQKKYIIEDFSDTKENEKIIDNKDESWRENKEGQESLIKEYINDNSEKGEYIQDNQNKY